MTDQKSVQVSVARSNTRLSPGEIDRQDYRGCDANPGEPADSAQGAGKGLCGGAGSAEAARQEVGQVQQSICRYHESLGAN